MTTKVTVFANHGWPVDVILVDPKTGQPSGPFRVEAGAQGDFHAHAGADVRVHEVQPAEEATGERHAGLPVAGYQPQSTTNLARVNGNKQDEERILRKLDALKEYPSVDQRWLAIGRTTLEQAYMAINRAIFRPGRAEIVE